MNFRAIFLAIYICTTLTYPCNASDFEINENEKDVIEPTYFETIVEVGGKYYHSDLSKPKTWFEAREHCESFDMKMATIRKPEEAVALQTSKIRGRFWLGARDVNQLRQFSWSETVVQPDPTFLEFTDSLGDNRQTCLAYHAANIPDHEVTPQKCRIHANDYFTLCESFDSHPPELRPLTTVSGKIFYTDKARRPMTWTNADTFCKNQTAKLATIISAEEYDALKSAYQPEHFNGTHWTAGVDALEYRQFIWDGDVQDVDPEILRLNFRLVPKSTCLAFYSQPLSNSSLTGSSCDDKLLALCMKQI